ncbi:hypothetical protein LBMAG53_24920 [Planctomycetota bacterium]|nr:hypothetical protein LBMAG53_24920 [Planctomycetota bacterium]
MLIAGHAAIVAGEDEATPDWVPAGAKRRMDPIQRLACAVVDRLGDRHLGPGWRAALPAATALISANSFGSVETTLRFAESVAAYGDRGGSPTPFTTSVHNSAAAALGELLNIHGPCTTLSQGGTGTLAALRLADLWLAAGRAPAALVVVGDHLHGWGRRVVTNLSASPWPVSHGLAAMWCLPDGSGHGRQFRLGRHPANRTLDGGALEADDEVELAHRAAGTERQRAPDLLGAWWPCCLAAVIPFSEPQPLQLRECEAGTVVEGWLATG